MTNLLKRLFVLFFLVSCGRSDSLIEGPQENTPIVKNNSFESRWKTTNANEQVWLPVANGHTYNFTVNWGDNSPIETITDIVSATHTYENAGDYIITISGIFPKIDFSLNPISRNNIVNVLNLGSTGLVDLSAAFSNCPELLTFVSGDSNTDTLTNMSEIFAHSEALTTIDLSNLNIKNVTNMDKMFFESRGLTSLNFTNWIFNDVAPSSVDVLTDTPANLLINCNQESGTIFGKTCH